MSSASVIKECLFMSRAAADARFPKKEDMEVLDTDQGPSVWYAREGDYNMFQIEGSFCTTPSKCLEAVLKPSVMKQVHGDSLVEVSESEVKGWNKVLYLVTKSPSPLLNIRDLESNVRVTVTEDGKGTTTVEWNDVPMAASRERERAGAKYTKLKIKSAVLALSDSVVESTTDYCLKIKLCVEGLGVSRLPALMGNYLQQSYMRADKFFASSE